MRFNATAGLRIGRSGTMPRSGSRRGRWVAGLAASVAAGVLAASNPASASAQPQTVEIVRPTIAASAAGCAETDGNDRYGTFRVGHLNIKHGMTKKKFVHDLTRVSARADMVSLNEVAGRIPFLRKWAGRHGWWYYPGQGSGLARSNATLARKCQFDVISRRSVQVPGPRLDGPPHRYINSVRYRHRATGMKVTLFTTHLYARIDGNGHPRDTDTAPEAIRHIRLLKKLVTAESRSAQVIVGADMNVDYSADKRVKDKNFPYTVLENRQAKNTPGLRSQYSQRGLTAKPTHYNNRRIDYLYQWVRKPAKRQLFMIDYYVLGKTTSDHNGIVAKFWISKLPAGGGMNG